MHSRTNPVRRPYVVRQIDLEDRWFSELWQSKYAALPALEKRTLRLHKDGGTQGQLEIFVEIMLQASPWQG